MAAYSADTAKVNAVEAVAGKIGGTLLFVLAAYVLASSTYKLFHRGGAAESYVGLAIAIVAAIGMPVLARAKLRVADQIGSRALRADAMESFTWGSMAWVLIAGLGANALPYWLWLNPAGALALVLLFNEWLTLHGCQPLLTRYVVPRIAEARLGLTERMPFVDYGCEVVTTPVAASTLKSQAFGRLVAVK